MDQASDGAGTPRAERAPDDADCGRKARRNLATELPSTLEELLGTLDAWRAEMARITGEPDPHPGQGLSLPYSAFMQRLLARQKELRR